MAEEAEETPDYVIFLHGSPLDHLSKELLDDVLRSLSLRTYEVPFLHLNVKRVPALLARHCIRELYAQLPRPHYERAFAGQRSRMRIFRYLSDGLVFPGAK